MERAKRLTAFLAAVLLVMVMTGAAYAAESSYNVWIDIPADSGTDSTLTIPVKTDGTATDGLAVITYDPAVLSVTAENVSKAGADMYSANVTEPGTLKISWIIGDTPKTGAAVNVTFTVLKKSAATGLGMTGEAYSGSAEEADRSVGTKEPAATEKPAEPTAQPLPENVEVETPSEPGAPSVSIPAQDQYVLVDSVLAEEDKEKLEQGVEIVVTLEVSAIDDAVPAGDKAAVDACVAQNCPGYSVGQYLDLSLFKTIGDEDPEQLKSSGKPITVVITVPEELRADGRVFRIIRIHEGKATVLEDRDRDPETITIQTDKFSTYAIAYAEGPIATAAPTATAGAGTNVPRTGDDTALTLWAVMAAACAAGVVLCARRLRRGSM